VLGDAYDAYVGGGAVAARVYHPSSATKVLQIVIVGRGGYLNVYVYVVAARAVVVVDIAARTVLAITTTTTTNAYVAGAPLSPLTLIIIVYYYCGRRCG
jgi:hypothetical protein